MNVTIFAGGTGSEELQKGLWNLFKDKIHLNIIINGYDDGKSTGIVRKVFNNEILGPSDLRKNHLFQHFLRYQKTDIYHFLNMRFSSKSPKEHMLQKLIDIENLKKEHYDILYDCIIGYFQNPNAYNYSYHDFNSGNIIYAYLFHKYSVQHTCEVMCDILSIPNNVHFQCDNPYKLHAVTQNGLTLNSEEEIVNFANYNDRIVDIFLLDKENIICTPTLKDKVIDIIRNSDIIIFSCGTLWSSLIPTYISHRFYDIIKTSSAKKYLVTNINNDKDMFGCVLQDYITLYNEYLPLKDITIIFEKNRVDKDLSVLQNYSYLFLNNIINRRGNLYDDINIISQIFIDYFRDYLKYNHLIFDYDYTLYDPKNIPLSNELIQLMYKLRSNKSVSILSGNHHKNITVDSEQLDYFLTNHGSYDSKKEEYIYDIFLLPFKIRKEILKQLQIYNIETSVIEDRDTSICVKVPNDEFRENLFEHLTNIFQNLSVIKTGKTSIEVLKLHTTKLNGYNYITTVSNDIPLYITDIDDIPELKDNKLIIRSMEWLYILLKTYEQSAYYLNDLIIVAGGINNRMNNVPKLLIDIHGQTLLDYIIKTTKKYINNVYIFTNNNYYHLYDKTKYNVILCKGKYTDVPNGNLETVYSGLKQIKDKCSNHPIVIWSDCIPNKNIISDISHIKSSFFIPCRYEDDPYAYLVLNEKDRKSTRLNSSHMSESRMPSSA